MKIKFPIIAIACLFACYFVSVSCGGGPTIQIPVDNVSIELNDIVVGEPQQSKAKSPANDEDGDELLNHFAVERTVSAEDAVGLTADALEYLSQIQSASVGSVSIIITDLSGEGTVVKDFELEAIGFNNKIKIAQYDLGAGFDYQAVTGDLLGFAAELMRKMFVNSLQDVTFTVKGYTDIPTGESLKITITMDDVVFEAKVIDVIKAF